MFVIFAARRTTIFPCFCLALVLSLFSGGSLASAAAPFTPKIEGPSDEGEQALSGFKLVPDLVAKLAAAEPLLAQPVAFCFDEQGRIYVAETFRMFRGVEDNRNNMDWLADDLAAQTVADRRAMFEKFRPDLIKSWTTEHDRVKQIVDLDGDGRYDQATIFADGFNDLVDGIGAGVLAHEGKVYYTCIPNLWMLSDSQNTGTADNIKSLAYGLGVRVAFVGHDAHGLVVGPDGKLYFTVGDRGVHIDTTNGVIHYPDRGVVLRCHLDGSKLEVVNTGLRNPQELAFDEYGNLFTGDNNSDGGDKARWVYLPEGSDSGWRMYYQYLDDRGPWNREKIWHPANDDQPAYVVPPICNFADGPSGLTYYPGVGLSDRYNGHFFLADFRGSKANSGVRTFAMQPKGAGFEMTDAHEFVWQVLATDVDFGYDGQLYISDWVDGWGMNGKGRIYSFAMPGEGRDTAGIEVRKLFAEGFASQTVDTLAGLLMHADYRVRQRAQFALARKNAVAELLAQAEQSADDVRFRLHGLWGLGQLAETSPEVCEKLMPFLRDPQTEVRAHAASILGECRYAAAEAELINLLLDSSARVRAYAAIALGKLASAVAVPTLVKLIEEAGNSDRPLWHAANMGLAGGATRSVLLDLSQHPSAMVRLAAVVALRRTTADGIGLFLGDSDPKVSLEAARAIYDLPMPSAYSQLAATSPLGNSVEMVRRILHANFILADEAALLRVLNIATDDGVSAEMRKEAVELMTAWNEARRLDRAIGDYRPRAANTVPVGKVVTARMGALLAHESTRQAAFALVERHKVTGVEEILVATAISADRPSDERVSALKALEATRAGQLVHAVNACLAAEDEPTRSTAWRLVAKTDPLKALGAIKEFMRTGSVGEQQNAVAILLELGSTDADKLLAEWIHMVQSGEALRSVALDVVEAASKRGTEALKTSLAQLEESRASDPSAKWADCLEGGNAARGRELFLYRSELSCRRCHKIGGDGSEVGPNLSMIGAEKTREYLLEAIADPNKAIAKGFETTIVQTDDGQVAVGIIKSNTDTDLTLMSAEGKLVTIAKSTIEEQLSGKSGMPEDLVTKMSKRDLRDLVEFLTGCKGNDSEKHGH